MTSSKLFFADIASAKLTVHRLYPKAKQVYFIEHSYDNLVALVDETYALRFPRNEAALARSYYERNVLQNLTGIRGVSVPQVLNEYTQPPCLVTNFLHGVHLTSAELRLWPQALQMELGEKVAHFAYQMHSLLPLEEARKLRQELKLDEQKEEPWGIYFAKVFSEHLPNAEQDTVARQYYDEWLHLQMNPEVVLHDDLHSENMLFQNMHLTGILDFGDTNIGSPEQELRQLYRINDAVLEAAVKTYERLSGLRLNVRAIKVWAILQELAVYIEHYNAGEFSHAAFIRTCHNLNRWHATDIWGKGLIANNVASRQ